MTRPCRAHAAIGRELARIQHLRRPIVHPAYVAIVRQAYVLGLPHHHAADITIDDHVLITRRRPPQFAWLLHETGSLLSIPEPNTRPIAYLHAARRTHPQAVPFWWDGRSLIRAEGIDDLIARMELICAELARKAEELL
jgi:hypothetical protein